MFPTTHFCCCSSVGFLLSWSRPLAACRNDPFLTHTHTHTQTHIENRIVYNCTPLFGRALGARRVGSIGDGRGSHGGHIGVAVEARVVVVGPAAARARLGRLLLRLLRLGGLGGRGVGHLGGGGVAQVVGALVREVGGRGCGGGVGRGGGGARVARL